MRFAARTMLGILVASCAVSTANAQTASPSTPMVAPPASSWPMADNLKLAEPMSRRLILNRGPTGSGGFLLERGGVLLVDSRYATGLDLAVAGSDRAVGLALEAHSKLVTSAVLGFTGLGLTLGSLVGLLAVGGGYASQNTSGSPPTGLVVGEAVSAGALVVGIVLEIVGIPYLTEGQKKECDAVNAYNSDLVDGLLKGR